MVAKTDDTDHPFATLEALYRAMDSDASLPREGFADRIVPGEGPVDPPLMLVGEQPGDQEDQEGRPFVGPAGKLLSACLEEAGIDRERCFVTNAVKRFKFAQRGKRRLHQTPTAGDIKHYRWWLDAEIGLVSPRVIVALGGTALKALTGEKTLGPVRGDLLTSGGREVLATIHPSYLFRFRQEDERHRQRQAFVHDLSKALEAAS